jgi:hypothetical protein
MASTKYALSKDSNISATGRYPKGMEGEAPSDTRAAIGGLFELLAETKALHGKVVGRDGRIVGTERSRLLERIDAIVAAVILVIRKISGSARIDLATGTDFPGPLTLDLDEDAWTLAGALPLRLASFEGSFEDFFRSEFSPLLQAFLGDYKVSALDGKISGEEADLLVARLRDILVNSLKMYFLLYHLRING